MDGISPVVDAAGSAASSGPALPSACAETRWPDSQCLALTEQMKNKMERREAQCCKVCHMSAGECVGDVLRVNMDGDVSGLCQVLPEK